MKTKGALYKHYKNKRDIFDSILERVCQLDLERSQKAGVPENDFDKMPQLSITLQWKAADKLYCLPQSGIAPDTH